VNLQRGHRHLFSASMDRRPVRLVRSGRALACAVGISKRLAARERTRGSLRRPQFSAIFGRVKTCFVVQGFGEKTDLTTGRVLNLDASYDVIKEAVEAADRFCDQALAASPTTNEGRYWIVATLWEPPSG
jgi:hypothetical protein